MRRKWWVWVLVAASLIAVGIAAIAVMMGRRIEPVVREQTIQYLRERFDAEVEIGRLHASMSAVSPLRVLLAGGRGALIRVAAKDVTVRLRAGRDLPPLLSMGTLEFNVDLTSLWTRPVGGPF